MRTRLFVNAGVLAAVLAAPLAAQGGAMAGMPGMNMDPTNKIVGSGKLPGDWMMNFDPARPARGATAPPPAPAMTEVDVQTMGTGMHFRTGPAATYWSPKNMATGEYTVSATFSQAKSMGHEAYGIFIGGSNLSDTTQRYVYFVVKPCRSSGDCKQPIVLGPNFGEFIINERTSNARPTALVPATHDAAVNIENATTGAATNKLAIHVAKDTVHFILNDKLVRAIPKSLLTGSTDGLAGIRVNHNLDIHVDGFGIKK